MTASIIPFEFALVQVTRSAHGMVTWRDPLKHLTGRCRDQTVATVYYLRLRAIARALRGPPAISNCWAVSAHRAPLHSHSSYPQSILRICVWGRYTATLSRA